MKLNENFSECLLGLKECIFNHKEPYERYERKKPNQAARERPRSASLSWLVSCNRPSSHTMRRQEKGGGKKNFKRL